MRATRYVQLRIEIEGRITAIGFAGGDQIGAEQVLLSLEVSCRQQSHRRVDRQCQ
jgi:multidrug efflux pump subunit AcrA (membrane-fusion protein)